MVIATVSIIGVHKNIETLSYYTSLPITVGDLVEVQIQSRVLEGIVIHIDDVRVLKQEIKKRDYAIRKINKILRASCIPKPVLYTLEHESGLQGASLAHIIDSIVPNIFLDKLQFSPSKLNERLNEKTDKNEASFIYTDNKKQIEFLEKNITENINSGASVTIICPTVLQVEKMYKHFKNLVPTIKYHGEETIKKKIVSAESLTSDTVKLLITTPSVIFLADKNTGQVFLYNDSSRYYYNNFTHINMNTLISSFCLDLNISVTIVDSVPSVNRYLSIKKLLSTDSENKVVKNKVNGKRDEIVNIDRKVSVNIIKMNTEDKKEKNIYISRELNKNIQRLIKDGAGVDKEETGRKILLYTQRKGSHTTSVCADCGEIKKCVTCERPLVLYIVNKNGTEERSYVCQNCKTHETVNKEKELLCVKCGSWRMETLGIGTNGLKNEIQKLYPNTPVFVLDTEHAKTKKSAIKIYNMFLESSKEKTSILIGTELLLPLANDIDLMAIISIDSLFAIPEYNMDAHVFYIIHNLEEKIKDSIKYPLILQTRNKEKVFDFITQKSVREALENELCTRKQMHLPPYTTVITYDTEFEIKTPTFLTHYTHYTIRIQKIYRTIAFVDSKTWETDNVLRDMCRLNLNTYNLQVNPEFLFRL